MACDRPIVALTTFCEASGASPHERRCVVHSIFNRKKDGRFGKTLAEICLRRKQYSEFNDDPMNNANLLRGATVPDNDPIFLDCLAAYDEVLSGAFDPTGMATHYTDKSISPPIWTKDATLSLETEKFRFYSKVP